MQIKTGVLIDGIRPEIVLALMIIREVLWAKFSAELFITSVKDGKHSSGSLHYKGCAVDIRTRHILQEDHKSLTAELKRQLGTNFDVVLEPDHLHIEFDPKNATIGNIA